MIIQNYLLVSKRAWKEGSFEQTISETELQLILLYFASQYVETKRSDKLAVLLVCENGIGTSSLLKQRLKKSSHKLSISTWPDPRTK